VPVAQTRGHAGKALLIAGVSVVLLLVVTWLVAQAASRGDVEIKLGDERFDAGHVDNLAEEIDDGGGLPFLYPDLVNRDRNLFVQHRGDDADVGWSAFGAFDPDRPECPIQIDREAKVLVNGCDPDVTYPPDGTGLRFYPTVVDDGTLYVDLNELSTTTTSARDREG
jgi:hypothetical protein